MAWPPEISQTQIQTPAQVLEKLRTNTECVTDLD